MVPVILRRCTDPLSDFQGRDLVTKVALALRADGRFLAMRADNISNVGGRCVSLSPLCKGSALVTGSYDIPMASLRSRAVFTNTMPTNACRSSGRPEVTYAIERLIDLPGGEPPALRAIRSGIGDQRSGEVIAIASTLS
jgi:CO/xanthine dehydrogenase Mo-binding subunit